MYKNISSKIILIVIFALLLSFVYCFSYFKLDNRINDVFTNILISFSDKKPSDDVVLISVDNKSTAQIPLPWQRNLYSDIINFLENYAGAKVIVLQNTLRFSDSYDNNLNKAFFSILPNYKNFIASYYFTNSALADGVLTSDNFDTFNLKNTFNISDKRYKKYKSSYMGIVNIPKDYLYNVNNFAASLLHEDNDGVVRNYLPVIDFNNKLYPSIALSAFSMYSGINDFVLYDNFLCSADNCTSFKMPLFHHSAYDYLDNPISGLYYKINWYKPNSDFYSHKSFSAVDVLNSYYDIQKGITPKINPNAFKDKIVLIGFNINTDLWTYVSETPVLKRQSDIDIHAAVISNMINKSFKSVPSFNSSLFVTLIFSLFIIFGFKNYKYNLIFTSLLCLLYFSYYIIEYILNTYVSPIAPILTMYCAALLKILYSQIFTDKTSDMIKRAMGKYISKDVMKKVISNLDKLDLGGVRAVVTVLFVDIRNFTQISENLSPQNVTSVLNEYFSVVEPVIGKYHGIINKYMGDGVLAVFGEPIKDDNHALNAIKCGMEITQKVRILRDKLINEGKPKIEIGIGINTGEVFAGNIGTEERFEYTVIGDNVNLAYRIEAYNQMLKTSFLISQYTYEFVKDYVDTVKLSSVNIKGKSKPIDIYEVLKIKNE